MSDVPASSPPPTIIIKRSSGGHGCLVTALWFLFIGWWASWLWISIAWLFIVFVVTMPIGLAMLNKTPQIASLREPTREFTAVTEGTITRIQQTNVQQRPFWLRAVYFFPLGIIVSLVWSYAAWFLIWTVIGLPLAIWMLNRIPAVTTLRRF